MTAPGLASFAASLSDSAIPETVRRTATRHVLDTIGVALAASGTGAITPVVDAVKAWGGTREASIIGGDWMSPAPHAALANGALAHALDFDDTHVESLVHASSVVVPAALAVAQEIGASGRSFITACVIGYEIAARIGSAASSRAQIEAIGIAGTSAAAAVAGRLWGLDADQLANALDIAASQSFGLFSLLDDGSETNRFHPGWAAHSGIVAADLARRGSTGPTGVLEGGSRTDEPVDAGRLVRGLGYEWETVRMAIKPYPACHFVHAFMDAARRSGVRPGDVEQIVCHVARPILSIVCEPRAAKVHPVSGYAARFSLPFAVSVALHGGREGLELFDEEARTDSRVIALAERVHVEVDDSLDFPASYGGRMTIYQRDGRERSVEEPVNRGHPDRPLTDSDVRTKFLANARLRLDDAAAQKLATAIEHLDEQDSVAEIARLAQGS